MEHKKFVDLDVNAYKGKIVILDVDGTLVCDGEQNMDKVTKEAVTKLGRSAAVFLLSNARSPERLARFSELTGVSFLDSLYKKPNPKTLETLQLSTYNNVVVIGDKILTDGILAQRIDAHFVKVARIQSSHERFSTSISYLLDALFGTVILWILRLRFF